MIKIDQNKSLAGQRLFFAAAKIFSKQEKPWLLLRLKRWDEQISNLSSVDTLVHWFLVQLFGDCFNKPLQSYQNIKGDAYILIYNDQFLQW